MNEPKVNREIVDVWLVDPVMKFIRNSSSSGLVLFGSATLAIIAANSPLSEWYQQLWKHQFSIGYDQYIVSKDLQHWINDGLMAVFFFVVGLELKREIIGGQLSNLRGAALPLAAAAGGMVFPALIYLGINGAATADGWGIPMATDIAFSLGVLYLLGDRVPISVKVFLTVLAIADDIGAVLVIAFFYSSQIDLVSLGTGAVFMSVLMLANWIGVRSTIFYATIGIGGLWLAFLMSGVHATIAAVLAAFTIPARTKINEVKFIVKMESLVNRFKQADPNQLKILTKEQLNTLQEIRSYSKRALTPMQRLEDNLHPLVAFVIMPVFAFCNAGIELSGNILNQLLSPVSLGVIAGLLIGKVIGVVGISNLVMKLTGLTLPAGMNKTHLWAVGFLAAVGFTMSLFVAGLAFKEELFVNQSKLGVLVASILASLIGFILMKSGSRKSEIPVS